MFLHQFTRRGVAALLLVSFLSLLVMGCGRIGGMDQPANRPSALVGKYILNGQSEAASEIELFANGKFVYGMVYGGLDEGAEGTWRGNDKQVILEVDSSRPGQVALPPSGKLELQRDKDRLIMSRNDNDVVYVKAISKTEMDEMLRTVKPGKQIKVDLVGYNYTDKYIQSFNVSGYGGGHIFLSSPTSGGGGPYCCFYYIEGIGFPYEVEVKWTNNASEGPWKTAKALIPEPKIRVPKMLEVHIFQDEHVEVELTDWYSPPRVELPRKNNFER
ncbi:DUF3304 domain-containing protein [Noviherbaspirillum denitrificans]|uniref:Uncharacterized protein n=1 Tax=Noviherbaspirillum denitrificans TaxID=1968433 RepID=A0A254TIG0_9BURK|nr:DUF3304 domain-containing protein [Noviherbaspirillum denitrificans]OWW22374.1 hypothetical protein AYR66_25645 [Noviherbaspirillum denitrificans]